MCNGTPFTVEKISLRVELELGTVRSVGQCLTHYLKLPGHLGLQETFVATQFYYPLNLAMIKTVLRQCELYSPVQLAQIGLLLM